jgi:23S rRNA pseudouridine1911/1915/1917 synthase
MGTKQIVSDQPASKTLRLDQHLATTYPDVSRSLWQKYIKQGLVLVNNDPVLSNKFEIDPELDTITVKAVKKDIKWEQLPVLYEDDNVTVINKPIGILTHAKGAELHEFTVADFIRPFTTDKPESQRAGIVHRLDRDTSGILIMARNPAAQSFLQKQFSERNVKKRYIAILDGQPKHDTARLNLPIERNVKAPATFRVGPNGKAALTEYRTLWSDEVHTLVELKPTTGRTHQLRVHMAYLNTPIHGDRFYGVNKKGERMMLHAFSLEITIPGGIRKIFTAPIPEDMKTYIPEEAWHELN